MSAHPVRRLPAAERRQALIEAALRVFSTGSYAGATTAEIAREAGVSEPILYRHFASKLDRYLACLDATWERFREVFDAKIAELDEENAVAAIGISLVGMRAHKVLPRTCGCRRSRRGRGAGDPALPSQARA